jgi:UDP-2-acetamido-3-amino-2,3-dideoxy-glucuronate N-acetyltransferase
MHTVHPTAVIDQDVEIGAGTRIWHFVHVSSGARIGRNCVLGQNVFVGRGVRIGDGVRIQNNVSVYQGVEVEDEAFLGPSCVFTNVLNPRAFVERKQAFRPTLVGRGATVGANATVLCGYRLGEYCLVGAGSVTVSDVQPHALVVGVPARRIGWVCRCGESLSESEGYRCSACGDRYRVEAEGCRRVE